MKVLVSYASAHGSTRGIAERVAADLRQQGHDATAAPVDPADPADGFDAYVLGSAVHNGSWLPQAVDHARADAGSIAGRPVWLFSVGMLGDTGSTFSPRLARLFRRDGYAPRPVAELRSLLYPVDHHAFVGAVERDHLPVKGRVMFRLMGGRYGDRRNWPEVDSWADGIAGALAVWPTPEMQGHAPG